MLIVIPFHNRDAAAARKNVQWMHELDGKTTFECLLSWPEGTKPEIVTQMREAAHRVFAKVHEFQYPESTETTWPAGANWAWQSVARWIPMITNYKGNTYPFEKVLPENTPWLFLEPDAVPLKPGWMQTLADEYRRGGKPFMGHIVKDMGHMNGVGVYPNHVSHFARDAFHAVHAAWDVVLKEQTIALTHNANHLIQHCWVLINGQTSHNGDGIIATFRDTGEMHRLLEPNAVLFHRTKDGSLIDCLMQTKIGATATTDSRTVEVPQRTQPYHTVPQPTVPSPAVTRQTSEEPIATTAPVPKTDIFIVTYFKDAEWLKYCLYSIKKFASGFQSVVVCFPDREQDIEVIEPIVRDFGPENAIIELFTEVEGKGMLNHMAVECMADQFCQSEYVLHTDSDCIFIEPVSPSEYFKDGKPVLLIEEYERFIDRYPTILQWKITSEKALKFECRWESMRRHPAVHPRAVYGGVRARIEKVHKMPFMDYVLSCKPDFPQGFSEFNVLGAYAKKEMPDFYHWIDLATDMRPKDKILQSWSHGGLDRPSDQGQFVPQTPREIFKRILGI